MVSPIIHRPASRFASPLITIRRSKRRATPCATQAWTLGDFLKAATKDISAALPCPGRRSRRHALSFSLRRGRSAKRAATVATTAAPPTAERHAQVQVLRTIGIIGVDHVITAAEMRAYDNIFAAPLPRHVLVAIAALVNRELPADPQEPHPVDHVSNA
jgi:hypothetical protein